MDIGLSLREARERRGLTLQQVARDTKIQPTTLDHIEHNRFDRLPGSIFAKGYLRAFAASVGVDGGRLIEEYVRQTAPQPPVVPSNQHEESPIVRARVLLLALGLLVVGGAIYFARDVRRPPASDVTPTTTTTTTTATTTVVRPSQPAPVATAGTTPPASSSTADAFTWPVHLQIDVTGDCWVSATADGRSVVYRLVRRGEAVSVTANDEVVLRVGDPTVLTYRLNGRPGRPVGRPGAPATVRINRETYRDLLQDLPEPTGAIGAS